MKRDVRIMLPSGRSQGPNDWSAAIAASGSAAVMATVCEVEARMYLRGVEDAIAFLGDDPAAVKLREELGRARERQAQTVAMIDESERLRFGR